MYQKCGCEMREFVCARSGSLFPLEKKWCLWNFYIYPTCIRIFTCLGTCLQYIFYSCWKTFSGRLLCESCVEHLLLPAFCVNSCVVPRLSVNLPGGCLSETCQSRCNIAHMRDQQPTSNSQQAAGRQAAELVKFSGPRARFVGEAHAHRRTHTQAPVSQSIAILVSPWMRLCLHRI